MNREEAKELVWKNLLDDAMRKHVLAVEAVMRGMAKHFNQDEETWALAGLLHDLDYEQTRNDPERHGKLSAEMLSRIGVDPVIIDAVLAHADKCERNCLINRCIYSSDPVTGLVMAAALIRPEKKLDLVELKSLKKRFKEKRFAAGADRDRIQAIEQTDMTLEQFLDISLESMKRIADDLGL